MTMKLRPITLAIAVCLAPTVYAASTFEYEHQWTFHHGDDNQSSSKGSEIVAYDPKFQRLWVVGTDANEANLGLGGIDILDLSGELLHGIDTSELGGINSVAIKNNQAAVAITAPVKTDPGKVLFFNTKSFDKLSDVSVGANPDQLTFTKDGSRLLVANEGEPLNYSGPDGDPEGSVSIIHSKTFKTQVAGFSGFNEAYDQLKADGIRLSGPNASVAQDLEPEYIAVSANGKQAMITLQENNAIALLDINSGKFLNIKALGKKNHGLQENVLDVSDKDGLAGNLKTWQVNGLFMPDGIASFVQKGRQYYVIANEGDGRDWQGWNDEIRVKDAVIDQALEAALIAQHGLEWKKDNQLGRLTVTKTGDLDGDGDLDELQSYGARSFSILDQNGKMVFDSGSQIEKIIFEQYKDLWDDARSDNKGPEPESAVIGKVNGRDLLFLGLERSNAVMVWDLTNLNQIEFLEVMYTQGNVGPEGLCFFTNKKGSFLAVANEVSETTSLYRVSIKR